MREEEFQILHEALRSRLADIYSVLRIPYGWRELIANLHEELFNIYPDYQIKTVTESVGRLMFRTTLLPLEVPNGLNRQFQDTIREYERASENVCMGCSSPNASLNNSWARALCPPCTEVYAEYFAKRNDLYTANVPSEEWPEEVIQFFHKIKGEDRPVARAG